MTELTGWGRYPRRSSTLVEARDAGALARLFAPDAGAVLRGAGRAYGDAAIGERLTVDARPLDRFIAFDSAAGRLSVEAGVMLADVLEACVPRGYFPPVVPGTKFVTIGGMIAADVHGKNHHRDGGFGAHVEELTLLTPTGERVTCSPTRNAELFEATVGGMGLTGAILDATFRLRPIETGWMRQTTHVAGDLDAALALLERTDESTYVVAWIDCLARGASLGRSLIFAAEHATRAEVEQMKPGAPSYPRVRGGRLAAPFDLPSFALSRPTVSAFNEVYFRAGARKAGAPFLVSWDPYFFPLDSISGWNRMYGRRGFVQHQCVLPKDRARDVLAEMLERVSRRGVASFLAVLKALGPAGGLMSFPMEGVTLALDLPVSAEVLALLDDIDALVAQAGGRLYLAKDARQSRATFEAGYPNLPRFRALRASIDAPGRLSSHLSARLGI